MKALLLILPWTLLTTLPTVGEGTPSPPLALETAQVTLPYDELLRLWKAASPPPPETSLTQAPPVDFAITQASYQLDLSAQPPTIRAEWRVDQFLSGWQLIPLLGGDVHLQGQLPEGRHLVWRDEFLTLMQSEAGGDTIALTFFLEDSMLRSPEGVTLMETRATARQFTIVGTSPDWQLTVNGQAVSDDQLPSGNATGNLVLRLEPASAVSPTSVPSLWSTQSESVVRLSESEGHLLIHGRLYLRATEGNGLTGTLQFPIDATDIVLEGSDLSEWKQTRVDGQRQVDLTWETPDVPSRVLTMSYKLPLPPFADAWALHAPTGSATSGRHRFTLVRPNGLTFAVDGLREGLEVTTLPSWLPADLSETAVLDQVDREGTATVTLSVQSTPESAPIPSVIPSASFRTRLVADGAVLVEASYQIAHEGHSHWEVTLPEDASLLTATVNGDGRQPHQEESLLSFPLTSSATKESKVTFSYTQKLDALDPITGKLRMELPLTALFIDRLQWALTIPQGYEIEATEGNVSHDRTQGATSPSSTLHLLKELCRDERPGIDLYYRRSSTQS